MKPPVIDLTRVKTPVERLPYLSFQSILEMHHSTNKGYNTYGAVSITK